MRIFSDFPWSSVGYKVLSCVFFSLLNALIKSLPLPVMEIVCLQNMAAGACILFFVKASRTSLRYAIFKDPWMMARAICAFMGVVCWTVGIQKLSLFQTVSLGFLGPIISVLGAHIFLREALYLHRIIAILMGCLGGLLVSFGSRLFNGPWDVEASYHVFPILAACCFSLSTVLGKKMLNRWSAQETAFSLFCVTAGAAVCVLIGKYVLYQAPLILAQGFPPFSWLLIGCLGGATAAAHFFMNKALSKRDLIFLIPFGSTRPLASAFLGSILFHETLPTLWMWMGSAVIMGSVMVLAWAHEK